jgi:hypothetical protein
VDFQIVVNGTAERRTAIEMVDQNLPGTSRITLGADKAYDTRTSATSGIAWSSALFHGPLLDLS